MRQVILLCIIALLAGCAAQQPRLLIDAPGGTVEVLAEVADTPAERERGLMHRYSLPGDKGMLFVFDKEEVVGFWMKDTPIPLDIIFINKDWEVVNIRHSAQPCIEEPDTAEPCESYFSGAPVRYVLEVNGGFAEQHAIGVGTSIRFLP